MDGANLFGYVKQLYGFNKNVCWQESARKQKSRSTKINMKNVAKITALNRER